MTATVLIVDDQPLFAQGLAMVLGSQPDLEVVGTPANGADALTAITELHPHVVLLDLRMPGITGLDVLSRLRKRGDTTPVLVLTTLRQEHAVYESLRLGAAGFLTKDATPDLLAQTLRKVLDGDDAVGAPELRKIIARHGRSLPDPVPVLPELSVRERTIFMLCARGLDNAGIAQHECVSLPTVKSQVSAILKKLGLTSRVQIPIYAYEHRLVSPAGTVL